MARRPRLFAPGLLYHVIVRGNQRQKTFASDEDFKAYLDRLEKYRPSLRSELCLLFDAESCASTARDWQRFRYRSSCRGYNNPIPSIIIVRIAKSGIYSRDRYKAIICDKDKYLLALIRYIHLIRFVLALVKRPEKYPYSGHGSYLTNGTAKIVETGRVLRLLGGKKSYEKLVLDATGEGHN